MRAVSVTFKTVSISTSSEGGVNDLADTPVDGLGDALVGVAEKLGGAA